MYLCFGDYYNDGHGRYHQTTIEIPSEKHLNQAIERVKKIYPHFFDTFCVHYDDRTIGTEVEKALIDTKYPMERFSILNDDVWFDQFESLEQMFASDKWKEFRCVHSIEFVADAIIWVLNAFDAEIILIDDRNYPRHQFSAGYGMFC